MDTSVPKGTIKRFGAFGPPYEVGEIVGRSESGVWMVGITVIGSGEKANYPLPEMHADPEAA